MFNKKSELRYSKEPFRNVMCVYIKRQETLKEYIKHINNGYFCGWDYA